MKLSDLLQKVAPIEPQDTLRADIILSMSLTQFKKARLLVRVRCRHLDGEDVFIASTEKEAEVGMSEGLVTYKANELIELVRGQPATDVIRQIHEIKKILQGTLLETKDRESVDKINNIISSDDLLYEFEERAAIQEYDGGLSRKESEKAAEGECA